MFLSFITDPESQDICSPEYLKTYCDNIIHTTVWGGEVELVALSHVYGVPISVYQSDAPTVVINEDIYDCDNMLRLSYHQHEFSLGRHYNSVVLNNH
jgi:OTU domain-containing protein 6